MPPIEFEWDPAKEAANRRKHGVSFDEGRTVFYDLNARLMGDPDHSTDEERFLLLGMSSRFRLLVVCHTYRRGDQVVRVISARKATRREKAQYTE
ncbi:MAG: BrnT family toxin [Planctomycetes bacterium]|nr:BrnT family toxin [Planctomycetota bacterium]